MRYIRKKAEPKFFKDWKQQFYITNGRQPVYDDLKGTNTYLKLKETLAKEQGYVCCYCEKYIGTSSNNLDCDIEHFMPRHPDKRYLTKAECMTCESAQLDYTNLMASCKGEWQDFLDHCNHKKNNWYNFKTCISPTDERIVTVFGYSSQGKIFPINGNAFGSDMQKHMNLNSEVLKRQRREAYITVLEQEFDDEELMDDIDYIKATIQEYKEMHDGRYFEFGSMISYCLETLFMGRKA